MSETGAAGGSGADDPEASDPPPAAEAESADSEEVAQLREELSRTQDRYRRALADLDNYRKRTAREAERREEQARRELLRDWLDAVDSVERALRLEPDDPGLTAVLAQMDQILGRHGVTRLDVTGALFDPAQHEAIAVQPNGEVPDQTVLDVARSGFVTSNGDVLRPAQVVVAKRPPGGS